MLETAVILAGGFGTRLQTVINDLPKPMAPVKGKPFLDYQLQYLEHYGIKKVIFSLGHLAEKIQTHYKNTFNGLQLSYVIEKTPLGTGGGIRLALEQCSDSFALVLNGDSFFEIDLNHYYHLHLKENSHVSLALRKVQDARRYGTIETDNMHRIASFKEKTTVASPGIINAGVYILDKELYKKNTLPEKKFSIEKDFFEKYLGEITIKGFEFNGYFIDIGIPEDYAKAQHDFERFAY
jgi:D-glycero-alpha-D-manno-heptose 1-phosphate guanylyltransferase